MKPFLEEFGKMQQVIILYYNLLVMSLMQSRLISGILQALRKSHESERRFINKCQDLASNIEQVKEKDIAYDAVMESNQKSTESLQRVVSSITISSEWR